MGTRHFGELLAARKGFSVCVGLDSDHAKLPTEIEQMCGWKAPGKQQRWFTQAIVDATADLVLAFKPNIAFYEAHGPSGFTALRDIIRYSQSRHPDVPVILDAKRTDIGNTNRGYVQSAFEYFRADAVTVNPYFGAEALAPFLEREDKGVFVLCRTSNPGAGEFQDLHVGGQPLYKLVAYRVADSWNRKRNCGLVMGATYPDELREVRELVGDDMPILVPGVGTQGGDLEKTVAAGRRNLIINSGSAILFASGGADFAGAARAATQKLHREIQAAYAA
ncbi:MAG: orotidine-5'-phosphate decarboxylase [bacterium]|nr:orotidine-5'-phosphate decarboxylase [bacterium]